MRITIAFIVCLATAGCSPVSNEQPETAEKKVSTTNPYFRSLDSTRYNAAFLIMDGVYNTELTVPFDIFQHTIFREGIKAMNVFMFINDGKFITSAGGAKSFEAALYLCEHLYGAEVARQLAQGLVIEWDVEEVPHLVVR